MEAVAMSHSAASSHAQPHAVTEAVPMAEVLRAAARELDHIVGLGLQLQEALSPFLPEALAAAPEIQSLDSLVQQASGLAAFLSALEDSQAGAVMVSPAHAAQGLLLQAQRDRLSRPLNVDFVPESAGALELF